MMCINIIIVLIVMFIAYELCNSRNETLVSKPSNVQRHNMIQQVLSNQELFRSPVAKMYDAREQLPWLDGVVYEDLRILYNKNQLNYQNINNVFK